MRVIDRADPDVIDGIRYPSSDGQPMAETQIHQKAIFLLLSALQDYFAHRRDVFIAADLFWYWERGNPSACIAPDVMVVPGAGNQIRRSYRSWEGGIPSVTFEMASENTWRENLHQKRLLYERLGVREYYIFDPENEFLSEPLIGFRMQDGIYEELEMGEDGGMVSKELGLRLTPEGEMLRLTVESSGLRILTRLERLEEQKARADRERAEKRKQKARADRERLEKEREKARADQERLEKEREKERADGYAAEISRLQAMLKAAGIESGGASTEGKSR